MSTLEEKMKRLPATRRKKVEKRAKKLIAEDRRKTKPSGRVPQPTVTLTGIADLDNDDLSGKSSERN
ncbi:MAG: hypothetical protein OXI02_07715 [Candidatus Dadabacteria bacterium]|nr:hypothetical protein [Candidatus Dadabacteria bacterium]MDE0477928.1 hypothetical protein [Candidatus Dadabacteria bacterium]